MAKKRPSARARAVRFAHSRGLTLAGGMYVMRGGDAALAERRGSSITKQANREINRSYAPVDREFTRRESQVRSLDAKRASDEEVFKKWVTDQQNAIRSEASGQQAQLQAMAVKQHNDYKAAMDSVKPAEGTPANSVVEAAKAGGFARESAAQAGLAGHQANNSEMLASVQTNNLAYAASLSAKRSAQTLQGLADVATDRSKAALQKASDLMKRQSGLFDAEIQKAQLRIGATQFGQKLVSDNLNKKAGRNVTRHGQNVASADREAARAQKDRQKEADFREKHGISSATWNSYSQSHKRRIIDGKKMGFGGGGGKGSDKDTTNRKQRGAYSLDVQRGSSLIQGGLGVRAPGGKSADRPDPKKDANGAVRWDLGQALADAKKARGKKGNPAAMRAVNLLVGSGDMSRPAAEEAVWRWLYPGKKLPDRIRKGRRTAIDAKPR